MFHHRGQLWLPPSPCRDCCNSWGEILGCSSGFEHDFIFALDVPLLVQQVLLADFVLMLPMDVQAALDIQLSRWLRA